MAIADTTPQKVATLTGFQRDLLCVLAGIGPTKGLAVKEELEPEYPNEITTGKLYPNLDSLADMGLVEKGTIDRRTNKYELTEEALEALKSRRDWEAEYMEGAE